MVWASGALPWISRDDRFTRNSDLALGQARRDDWLNPDPRNLAAQHAIVDERKRPHFWRRMEV